ncbi:MAG: 2'-5' RNA ligase [Chloroflexi bacterium RBG_16_68_14]|nr:MAG: 2'-5' RNA ligase [Chloroflexi bacterium RBG_16_68_14]
MAKEPTEELRLFVACELPDDVRQALGRLQDDLRRLGASRLRWVRPEGIHVTLKFLGAVEASRVEKITSALAAAVEPFELRLRPAEVGGFGGARLRVVWVGLEGDIEALASLAKRVDRALRPLGFPREGRPFAAHLTLARVPDLVPSEERQQLAGLIERYRPPPLPSMILREVYLMRSILGPGGSVYQRLASFPREA